MTNDKSTDDVSQNCSPTNRRRVLKGLGAGAVLASGGLAGCLGDGDDTQNSSVTSGSSEITLKVMRPGYTDRMPNLMEPATKAFEEEHSDVTVEPVYIGHGQKFQEFATKAGAGTQPHIVLMPDYRIPQLQNQAGVQINLADYLSEDLVSKNLHAGLVKENYGGPLYAFPGSAGMTGGAIYYHRNLYEKAGLEGPPETTDDLEATMQALQENTDAAPIGLALSTSIGIHSFLAHWGTFAYGFLGSSIIDGLNGDATFDNEAGRKGTRLWKSMKPYVQNQPTSFSRGDLRQPFSSKKTAHHIDGPWCLSLLNEEYDVYSEDSEIQSTVAPTATSGAKMPGAQISLDCWAIMRDDTERHVEMAAKFIEHISSRKWQNRHSKDFGSIPIRSDIKGEEDWTQTPPIQTQSAAAEHAQVAPYHEKAGQVQDIVVTGFQKIWTDQTSIDEGLSSMTSKINDL